ncbi:hypothetical protein BC828DRAFT_377730 [Blastocladiella britannica]|nr:hypothetical protein BC828DRAFT_377730 [Blastocladiella britannica]
MATVSLSTLPADVLLHMATVGALGHRYLAALRACSRSLSSSLAPIAFRNPVVYSASHLAHTLRALLDHDCAAALHTLTLSDARVVRAHLEGTPLQDPFVVSDDADDHALRVLKELPWDRFSAWHLVTIEGCSADLPFSHALLAPLVHCVAQSAPTGMQALSIRFLHVGPSLDPILEYLGIAAECASIDEVSLSVLGASTAVVIMEGVDVDGSSSGSSDDTASDSGWESLPSPIWAPDPLSLPGRDENIGQRRHPSRSAVRPNAWRETMSRVRTLRLLGGDLACPAALALASAAASRLDHLDVRSLDSGDLLRLVRGLADMPAGPRPSRLSLKLGGPNVSSDSSSSLSSLASPAHDAAVLAPDLARLHGLTHLALSWEPSPISSVPAHNYYYDSDATSVDPTADVAAAVASALPNLVSLHLVTEQQPDIGESTSDDDEIDDEEWNRRHRAPETATYTQCQRTRCLRRVRSWTREHLFPPVQDMSPLAPIALRTLAAATTRVTRRTKICDPLAADLERLFLALLGPGSKSDGHPSDQQRFPGDDEASVSSFSLSASRRFSIGALDFDFGDILAGSFIDLM